MAKRTTHSKTPKAKPKKPSKLPAARRSTWNIRSAKVGAEHDIEFIARGLWVHGSQVLLCQNIKKGYFYLPGGHIEFGESAGAAAEREFLEETGLTVAAGELLLASEGAFQTGKRWHHEFNLVFGVSSNAQWDGRPARPQSTSIPPPILSREKHIAFVWIDVAAVVDLDIRPLAVKAWLAAGVVKAGGEWVSEFPSRKG